jgi:membrane-associated phospholipid phosphatase
MQGLFRKNPLLSGLIILYLLFAAAILIIISKGDEVSFLNGRNTPFLDVFFSLFTLLGDGLFVVLVSLIFLFFRFYNTLMCMSTYLFSSLVVQFFKKIVFSGMVRPAIFLKGKYILHQAPGVEIHNLHSFPSGHSASAFALAVTLALLYPRKKITAFFFVAALLVCISRIYLGQHFFMDTVAGSVIGIVVTYFTFNYFENHLKLNTRVFFMKKLILKKG